LKLFTSSSLFIIVVWVEGHLADGNRDLLTSDLGHQFSVELVVGSIYISHSNGLSH